MRDSLFKAFTANFMGDSPVWYKYYLLGFLIINPFIYFLISPFIAGWVLIAEFIFTLAMALKCYPLPAAGLLAIEAMVLGMTTPEALYHEVAGNLPVILLLMFMVAGIHFMKDGLRFVFTRVVVGVRSKVVLSLVFSFLGAFLSAFLDALTVVAVIIAVAYGFYTIYSDYLSEHNIPEENNADLDEFRGFLRNLMMHGAVGTALGGALTLVGEPQNLLIGKVMDWNFVEFFIMCAPVSIPVLLTGLVTCILLEVIGKFGYGYSLPEGVRAVLKENADEQLASMDSRMKVRLASQAVVAVILVVSLATHVAEVGFVGLMVIILLTAFTGVTEEHHFGEAFTDALPFTALLVVFFAIVAVIHDQHLFTPVLNAVLAIEGHNQLIAFFMANGILSAISDNVFVATVYITEVRTAFQNGLFGPEWFNKLAVAVNMGTNIPSVATPNGQAAFLFLLTSSLAPVIRLSYLQMVKLALPYTVTMVAAGILATMYLL